MLIAYQSTIGAYIFYYRSCNIYATASISKETVIENAVCELALENCSMILNVIAEMRLLRIANSVPQLTMPITGSEPAG